MWTAAAAASRDSRAQAVTRDRDVVGADSTALVVLIEDDCDLRETLQKMLLRSGYRVAAYAQARSALEELDAGLNADLVLLDLMMPGMNGWQFRVEQRHRAHLRDLPVIAISADLSAPAAAIDAEAFVQKPFDLDRLLTTMERVLLVRDRKRLVAKSIELERVRLLGMVVAGVTHEINNPLGYLLGRLELAERRLEAFGLSADPATTAPFVSLAEDIAAAKEGADRISSVVKLLSTFSRKSAEETTAVDVVRTLEAAARIAMHRIHPRAQLVRELSPVRKVLAKDGQLAQVFINLLVNAAQATAESAERSNTVRAKTFEDGDQVVIEISDTGVGIAPEIAGKIFEPFFTTKPPGEGTGLGLSISRDIVESFGGTIEVQSALDQGATFRVMLPAYAGTCSDSEETPTPVASGGGGRVLVIDDEPGMRALLSRILEGHWVEAFADPRSALGRIAHGDFDAVICDLWMPEMSGIELFEELHRLRPELARRFVLMTGSVGDARLGRFAQTHGVEVLRKPFRAAQLSQCLERIWYRLSASAGVC